MLPDPVLIGAALVLSIFVAPIGLLLVIISELKNIDLDIEID